MSKIDVIEPVVKTEISAGPPVPKELAGRDNAHIGAIKRTLINPENGEVLGTNQEIGLISRCASPAEFRPGDEVFKVDVRADPGMGGHDRKTWAYHEVVAEGVVEQDGTCNTKTSSGANSRAYRDGWDRIFGKGSN